MTTSIAGKLKVINKISNITKFDTDEFSTWRSAFRECAKLSAGTISKQDATETKKRLKIWKTVGRDRQFGEYSLLGAKAGIEYGKENKLNIELMKLINDREWLEKQFRKLA